MKSAVIVEAKRTPIGRAIKGATAATRPALTAARGGPTRLPPMTISETAALDSATRSIDRARMAGTSSGETATASPANPAATPKAACSSTNSHSPPNSNRGASASTK